MSEAIDNPEARTVTVPAGNNGLVTVTFVDVGTVLLAQYNLNGGGLTTFSSGDVLPQLYTGDTLIIRTTGDNAGESRTYTIKNYGKTCLNGTGVHTGA